MKNYLENNNSSSNLVMSRSQTPLSKVFNQFENSIIEEDELKIVINKDQHDICTDQNEIV